MLKSTLLKPTLFILLSLTLTIGYAQKRYMQKAEAATKSGNYQQALQWMQQGIAEGYVLSDRESLAMGELYYALGRYTDAVQAYKGFFQNGKKDTPNTLLHYIHALNMNGGGQTAKQMLDQGKAWYPSDLRFSQSKEVDPQVRNYFDHTHKIKDTFQGVIQLVKEPNGDLYGTDLSGSYDQLWTKPQGGAPSLVFEEAKYNQGGVTFSADGTTAYVAMNAHQKNKLKLIDNSYSPLQIFKFTRQGTSWSSEEKVSVSSDLYSTSSPALSPDGSYLYFVSDRPGGIGQTDIYRAPLLSDGRFGKEELLDQKVNTEGKESHVYVDENNVLYFSSDGLAGLGGLDVFALDLNDPEAQAYNLGTPINTSFDDFAYSIRDLSGFVSSNRGGIAQSYHFELDQPLSLAPKFDLTIDFHQSELAFGAPIVITLEDQMGKKVWQKSITPGKDSNSVLLEQLWKAEYTLVVTGEHIATQSQKVQVDKKQKQLNVTTELQSKYESGVNLLDQFGFAPILFDFNQTTTRINQLSELSARLIHAKAITLEGHSDQIGAARYNKKLSLARAQYVKQSLIKSGIDADKISVVGYGENKLLHNCRTHTCSQEQQQANRRVEIKAVF